VHELGRVDYAATLARMQAFVEQRERDTPDEVWLLEHEPVYTLGINADIAHVIDAGDIPVVQVDRGGQVTYHGPGQLIAYVMLDMRRARLGVRDLVTRLETAVIDTLSTYGIRAAARCDAPGVYVGDAKIASLGLRIRKGSSYHGLAVNVDMELEPFSRINPCGYAGMPVTQVSEQGGPDNLPDFCRDFRPRLLASLTKPASSR
jgi:lipoyl(octanoyl) transferase